MTASSTDALIFWWIDKVNSYYDTHRKHTTKYEEAREEKNGLRLSQPQYLKFPLKSGADAEQESSSILGT